MEKQRQQKKTSRDIKEVTVTEHTQSNRQDQQNPKKTQICKGLCKKVLVPAWLIIMENLIQPKCSQNKDWFNKLH